MLRCIMEDMLEVFRSEEKSKSRVEKVKEGKMGKMRGDKVIGSKPRQLDM